MTPTALRLTSSQGPLRHIGVQVLRYKSFALGPRCPPSTTQHHLKPCITLPCQNKLCLPIPRHQRALWCPCHPIILNFHLGQNRRTDALDHPLEDTGPFPEDPPTQILRPSLVVALSWTLVFQLYSDGFIRLSSWPKGVVDWTEKSVVRSP
jgi:hypothetical protein